MPRLRAPDGLGHSTSAHGSGPVDALCRAINNIVDEDPQVVEFSVNAITEGLDAVGEVTMRLCERAAAADALGDAPLTATGVRRPRVHSGYGVHTDIVVAAGEAYVSALNKMLAARAACVDPARSESFGAADARYIPNTRSADGSSGAGSVGSMRPAQSQ